MVVPLLPFYATRMGANGFTYTMLVSAFSLATLLSAPLWGGFSDKYGRRPALLIALGASAISYVIFGYANSLAMLFLSRIVQGAGGGTVGVVQAYVADSTEPENRARALGWVSAATNLGVTVGPLIGSGALVLGDAPSLVPRTRPLAGPCRAWCPGRRHLRRQHVLRLAVSPGIARRHACRAESHRAPGTVARSALVGDPAPRCAVLPPHLDLRDRARRVHGVDVDHRALPRQAVRRHGQLDRVVLHVCRRVEHDHAGVHPRTG